MLTLYVPSPNFHPGRRAGLLWCVWHSTEGTERLGAAESVARNWFALTRSGVSAHVVVDDTTVVECVPPQHTAWHAARANAAGYGIEVVGRAGQGDGWRDEYSLRAIRNACAWIRTLPQLAHIPARWLTDDQLRAGEPGHITHAQVSRVLGGTNHTDPGPDFPYDVVMAELDNPAGLLPPHATRPAPMLRRGSVGEWVRSLQAWLNAHDWTPDLPLLVVDGRFGPATESVVRGAQAQCGVAADGIVGKRTWTAFTARGWRP